MTVYSEDMWEKLSRSSRPIVLYGTGNGADKILDELTRLNIPVAGVFASDGFVRNRTFRGFEVLSYAEAQNRFPDMTVLFCFGSSRPEVLENISRISSEHAFLAPDVPVYGHNIFNRAFYEAHKGELSSVRDMLADEQSVRVFDDMISYKLTGDISFLRRCETVGDSAEILNLPSSGVHYLDLGAFTGDTVAEFIRMCPDYSQITAVEPDKRNFRKLKENTKEIKGITLYRAAVSDTDGTVCISGKKGMGTHEEQSGEPIPSVTVDTLLGEEAHPVFIKADVEGNELKMISGAAKTVAEKSPYMVIDCYHRSEDLFTLPLAVMSVNSAYRVYMRHRPYVPAWETMFFFVPV